MSWRPPQPGRPPSALHALRPERVGAGCMSGAACTHGLFRVACMPCAFTCGASLIYCGALVHSSQLVPLPAARCEATVVGSTPKLLRAKRLGPIRCPHVCMERGGLWRGGVVVPPDC